MPTGGIAYDPSNGFLYVPNCNILSSACTVTAFSQYGYLMTLSGSFPGLNGGDPDGIAYDPSDGFLYVANYSNNTVTAYDQNGNQQTLSGSLPGLSAPVGITVVP